MKAEQVAHEDELLGRLIQMEGVDALLDTGVSVPLKALRLPFKKRPVEIRVTMRRPCLSGQMAIARLYLQMNVTSEEMWRYTKEQEMEFLAKHGDKVARMIALTICRSPLRRKWLLKPMSWIVKNYMSNEHLLGAMKRFVGLMGTDPFINIIRSAERTNPMKLKLSQRKRKGS